MLTFYQHFTKNRKDRKIEDFDVGQMNVDRKRTEEGKINKTCALVPNNISEKEGATVAASHLPSQRAVRLSAGRAAFYNELPKQWERVIKY
jgi:hypothetical protein